MSVIISFFINLTAVDSQQREMQQRLRRRFKDTEFQEGPKTPFSNPSGGSHHLESPWNRWDVLLSLFFTLQLYHTLFKLKRLPQKA